MRKRVKVLMWLLCLAWLAILIWLSSEDGPATARTSGRLAALVIRLFGLPEGRLPWVNSLLRKLAHFGGFCMLGGLACAAARLTWVDARHLSIWVVVVCAALSALDEAKKVFIPGRHLSWPEAGLNALGALCGVLAVMGIFRWVQTRQKKSAQA